MTLTEIAGDAPFESFYLNQSSTLRGLRGQWAMSDVRRAIDSGWFVGPTIIDSDGPAEIRKAVRRSCYGSTRRAAASLNKA
jgi:hypothetical protein